MPEIVRSIDGRIIGSIENGVFTKRVQGIAHMLRTPLAWAIDYAAFNQYVLPNTHTIRIEEQQSATIYEISTEVFNDKKVKFDRGFGYQYFVILEHWHQIRKGQRALL